MQQMHTSNCQMLLHGHNEFCAVTRPLQCNMAGSSIAVDGGVDRMIIRLWACLGVDVCSRPITLLVNVTLLEMDSADVSSGNELQLRTDIRMHANHRDMGGSTTSRCKLPIHC